MAATLGKNAKAYYHATAGTALSAMTEMTEVRDLTVTREDPEVDVATRGNPGAVIQGEGAYIVTFDLICTTASLAYIALRTCRNARTLIAFAALTGAKAVTASEGPSGDWAVLGLERVENLADAIRYNVRLRAGGGDAEWCLNGAEAGT